MMIKLTGGKIYDPANRSTARCATSTCATAASNAPGPEERIDLEYDLSGRVVMAGAIDIHTHIAGGKVNLARMLLPEDHRRAQVARSAADARRQRTRVPSTFTTGYRYAEMGYTACFEPAMLPTNARHAHLELADTPIVDKGAFAAGQRRLPAGPAGRRARTVADQRLRRLDRGGHAGDRASRS